MISRFILLVLGIALQGEAVLPAAPSLVNLPKGNFACSIEVAPHDAPKPDPAFPERRYSPVLQKLVITQVGNIRRDVGSWSNGTSSELWWVIDKAVSVMQGNQPGAEPFMLAGELRDRACPKLLHFSEDSVSWISEASKTDPKPDKAGLLHYRAEITLKEAEGDAPPEKAVYQAWIDSKTLMPAKFDDGNALYTLKFSSNPSAAPLVMPSKVQAEVDLWQRESAPRAHL
jgi:hypothetical protein